MNMKAQKRKPLHASAIAAAALTACAPDLPDTPWLVEPPRILAVQFDPAEVAPGTDVAARALVASRDGTVNDAAVEWSFCQTPKPPAENRTVNEQCLGPGLETAGEGPSVYLTLPPDGCALFGPETPPGDFRPRDPDATGGYYQPIRMEIEGQMAFGLARIKCNLRSAPSDVALELKARYENNLNPAIASVEATIAGKPVPLDQIPAGAEVRFSLRWPEGAAENYVVYDPLAQAVAPARENLSVAWYTTGTALDPPHVSVARSAASAGTLWHAPRDPGTIHFWAVLRDSRGGSDFTAWDAVVIER